MDIYVCQHSVFHGQHTARLFTDKKKADEYWQTCVEHIESTPKHDHSYTMFKIPIHEFLPLDGEQQLDFSKDDADWGVSQRFAVQCWYDVKKHPAIKNIGFGWSSHHFYNDCKGESCECAIENDDDETDNEQNKIE